MPSCSPAKGQAGVRERGPPLRTRVLLDEHTVLGGWSGTGLEAIAEVTRLLAPGDSRR
ncbi:hypothetical protein ACFXI6_44180 [Streptomyces mirabilis]